MKQMMSVVALGALLAACGDDQAPKQEAEEANTLSAGDYEISSEVTRLTSSDKSVPATKLKLGDKATSRACAASDGTPDAAMFVEAGDTCTVISSYVRSGRLSIQYQCDRPGKGTLYTNADGAFTATGFEVLVNSNTSFAGTGDYQLGRHLTAKRVGACPPAAAPAKP